MSGLWWAAAASAAPLVLRLILGGWVVAGACLLLRWLVPQRWAETRVAIGRAGVLALLALPVLSVGLAWQWTAPVSVPAVWQSELRPHPAGNPASTAAPAAWPGGPVGPEVAPGAGGEEGAPGEGTAPDAGSGWYGAASLAGAATVLWVGIAGALLLRLLVGVAALHVYARRAGDVTGEVPTPGGGGARVRVLRGGPFPAPWCWGVWRPTILLPASSSRWSAERTRAVLLHEISHTERRDPFFLLLGRVACALHWANPLAWLLLGRLIWDGELVSDAAVLAHGVGARSFARVLVELAEEGHGRGPAQALGVVRAGSLTRRVARLMERPAAGRTRWGVTGVATVLLASATLATATAAPSPPDPAAGRGQAARNAGGSVVPADTSLGLVVDALVGALDDSVPAVRRSAVNSLRDIGDPRGLEALRRVLGDSDPDVRRAAAVVLGLAQPRPNLRWRDDPGGSSVSPDSVRTALAALSSTDPNARQAAANELGRIGGPGVVPALMAAYRDADDDVRQAVVSGLGQLADPRAVPVLVVALRERSAHVRQVAAEALGRLWRTSPEGLPAGDTRVPEGRTAGDSVQMAAEHRLRAPAACSGAGASPWRPTGLPEAITVLLEDPDAERREAAARGIGRMAGGSRTSPSAGPGPGAPPGAKDYGHALAAAASDPARRVRLAAICSLGLVGDQRALEPLSWRQGPDEGEDVARAAAWAERSIRQRAGAR